ncbi:MAG: tetratricopeptide repeat protein [Rhodospirillales bacterium]|nr:tetratricopeptide repeat protein [Rhodospirillales bacterium]
MAADDHRSQVEQILRVAESTRAGGDLASAVGLYRRAHLLAPERADALVEMGRTQFELGAIADSAQAFTKAIRLEPGSGAARYGLGKSLTALNKPRDAAEQFRHAVAIEPANPDHHNGLGVALDYASDHPAAQQAYINGLEINPDDIKLRNNLAFSMLLDGDFADAIQQFEEIASNPLAGPTHRQNLALAYGLAGQMEKAAQTARRDLNEDQVRHNLSVYERLRNESGAERVRRILNYRDSDSPER